MGVRFALLVAALAVASATAQDQGPTTKPFAITLRNFEFEPARIEVTEDDLVKIELHSEDIAHSLTIDDYRISKRVDPGQTVTFEFRADRTGPFTFYCNLSQDAKCKDMKGTLTVR